MSDDDRTLIDRILVIIDELFEGYVCDDAGHEFIDLDSTNKRTWNELEDIRRQLRYLR